MTELNKAFRGLRGGEMRTEPHADEKLIDIVGRCVSTDEIFRVTVYYEELRRFALDPVQRLSWFRSIENDRAAMEFLISGISPAGWNSDFGKEDE